MTEQSDLRIQHEDDQRRALARVVKSQRKPNDHAWKWRFYRRVSWGIVAEKLRRRLQQAADEARIELPWEHLYVHPDAKSRSVSMRFGQHPLPGIIEDDLEVGASMVISQDSRGGVVILLFPFESLNLQQSKPKVIWGYFDGPELLTEQMTRTIVRDFLRYGCATSGLMSLSLADRLFVEILEERSRALESKTALAGLHPWAMAILVLGSVATLALLVTWFQTKKGDTWEPLTGIVALLTGWVAAGAQKLGKARDEARGRALAAENVEKAERDRRLKEKRELRKRRKHVP